MRQSGGFIGRLLGPLLKTGLLLIRNVAASVADAGIHKEILAYVCPSATKTTTLIISDDKMKDIIEIVKSLKDSSLLLKKSQRNNSK